jgi:hypothetical protein
MRWQAAGVEPVVDDGYPAAGGLGGSRRSRSRWRRLGSGRRRGRRRTCTHNRRRVDQRRKTPAGLRQKGSRGGRRDAGPRGRGRDQPPYVRQSRCRFVGSSSSEPGHRGGDYRTDNRQSGKGGHVTGTAQAALRGQGRRQGTATGPACPAPQGLPPTADTMGRTWRPLCPGAPAKTVLNSTRFVRHPVPQVDLIRQTRVSHRSSGESETKDPMTLGSSGSRLRGGLRPSQVAVRGGLPTPRPTGHKVPVALRRSAHPG